MTSTPHRDHNGRPRRTPRHHPTHDGHDNHARRRTASLGSARRRIRGPRPTTFWAFADAEQLPGTAQLAGWLGRTVVTLVTTYTSPGDRVLLLTPPAPNQVPPRATGRVHDSVHYGGLAEAVWTVSRLGRSVDTAAAVPVRDQCSDRTDSRPVTRNESVTRPRPSRLGLRSVAEPSPDSTRCARADGDRSRGTFDLIITAVDPGTTDWIGHTDWNTQITPEGIVALITHSERRAGRLVEPIAELAATLGNYQLRCLDHIAVQSAHASDFSVAHQDAHTREGRVTKPSASLDRPVHFRQVHHDLVLFARPSVTEDEADVARGGETSDV
ncbi:hypothetical protein DMC64_19020 [Amycolatopsis sp. WAC 04197]|uniref:hypothetical protein n=1 Tax=Amycolatopsis sp. WAC 04197 TaxID=2203199 RepID=UPI000F79F21F|nr:hypothetical protein [Amycolatopsis sp. WAC 04197]RSN44968.1 hypothetical protein DMC64_19020 [Amycolatopsis sp. WAC 04197]